MNKISVITVCYNEPAEKIKFTFDSVLDQEFATIEFIVIDGGSGEETLSAIRPYLNRIKRFISEPDRGIFDAMNKGIKLATGTWISFMNVGDSFFNKRSLANLVLSNHGNAGILYGDVDKRDLGIIHSPRILRKYSLYESGICHQAMITRREVFERIGDFDLSTNLYGDSDWVARAFLAGISFFHVPEIICVYEGGGASADHTIFQKERESYLSKYFNRQQRLAYWLRSLLRKVSYRVVKRDLRLPYFLAARLKVSQKK